MWYWQRNRHRDQRNGTENTIIDPHKYSQQIFDKGAKANHGDKIGFLTNSAEAIGYQKAKIKLQAKYLF